MSLGVIKFLAYGLFGERLLGEVMNKADTPGTVLPIGVIIAVTIAAVCCISHFKQAKQYLAVLLTVVAYICLIGGVCAVAMLIVWLILMALAHAGEDDNKKQPSRSAEEEAARDAALRDAYQRLHSFSERRDSCLTEDKKSEFLRDASWVMHSSSATPEDYDRLIGDWEHYLYDPMPGSRNGPRL